MTVHGDGGDAPDGRPDAGEVRPERRQAEELKHLVHGKGNRVPEGQAALEDQVFDDLEHPPVERIGEPVDRISRHLPTQRGIDPVLGEPRLVGKEMLPPPVRIVQGEER